MIRTMDLHLPYIANDNTGRYFIFILFITVHILFCSYYNRKYGIISFLVTHTLKPIFSVPRNMNYT